MINPLVYFYSIAILMYDMLALCIPLSSRKNESLPFTQAQSAAERLHCSPIDLKRLELG